MSVTRGPNLPNSLDARENSRGSSVTYQSQEQNAADAKVGEMRPNFRLIGNALGSP